MPQAPNVEGLPLWLQVAITLIFGIATLGVMFRGYFSPKNKTSGSSEGGSPTVAHITDTSSIRNNSEQLRSLEGTMLSLQRSVDENTHYLRTKLEIEREVCQRLREIRERIDAAIL